MIHGTLEILASVPCFSREQRLAVLVNFWRGLQAEILFVNRGKLYTETSDLDVLNLMRFWAVHFVVYQPILEISYWSYMAYNKWVKVKWSRYRPGVTHRVGRGIALHFHDRGTRRGVSGQQHALAALYPRQRPGTHFTGGCVGPRAGLDRRKITSPPGFDPGPSSP